MSLPGSVTAIAAWVNEGVWFIPPSFYSEIAHISNLEVLNAATQR